MSGGEGIDGSGGRGAVDGAARYRLGRVGLLVVFDEFNDGKAEADDEEGLERVEGVKGPIGSRFRCRRVMEICRAIDISGATLSNSSGPTSGSMALFSPHLLFLTKETRFNHHSEAVIKLDRSHWRCDSVARLRELATGFRLSRSLTTD